MNKLTLILLLLSLNLFSQEITEEQRGFYTKILHGADSIRFNKTKHNVYKFEQFNKSDFYKEIITSKEISSCTKLAKESAQLSINEENQLVLSGKLTERFNEQIVGDFSINLIENNLSKKNGEKFELHTFYTSHSGYGKIDFKIDIKSEFVKTEKISGFVKFGLNYLTGYDKIEITTNDIGKNITLNNCEYTIVNIKENEIILDKISKLDNELNVINFNKKGEVAKPYSYMELMKMVKQDSTIAMESFNRKNRQTYKMVRDLFEKNPKVSLEEFREVFTIEKLLEMKEDGQYEIIESIAPFENKITLYSPKFQTEIIKVEMK